jgi:hypothetical protein
LSYINPYINTLNPIPIGIDRPIESLRSELETNLIWLSKSFGRAYEFKEVDANGKLVRIPKCYTQKGEYLNVLPNDTLFTSGVAASSFIALEGKEDYYTFNKFSGSTKRADLSIIFWCNLKLIDPSKDWIFTEELKADAEQVIKRNAFVEEIKQWVDERAEDVFDSYDLQSIGYNVNDASTQYLMYPYSGFRALITVVYDEPCDDLALINWDNNIGLSQTEPDIDFRVGDTGFPADGETTYQNNALINKKIRLFRNSVKQTKVTNEYGYSFGFDPTTGVVTVTPAYKSGEFISIEIY